MPPPRGVLLNEETGQWAIPVLFGLDANSLSAAERFALDHNNLTMAGGDFTSHNMMHHLYNPDTYLSILDRLNVNDQLPITVGDEDIKNMKASLAGVFDNNDDQIISATSQVGEAESLGSLKDSQNSNSNDSDYDDPTKKWPMIKARIRPDLYELFLEYTDDFGKDDDERIEGWLLQYQDAKNKTYID